MASEHLKPNQVYSTQRVLQTPAHITCLAFGHAGHLFAGSDDGSLRVYDLSSFKVIKAIRGLGCELSSLACVKNPGSELRDVWLACGSRVMRFQMDSPKMIQTQNDALLTLDVGDPNKSEEILNEIALNSTRTHLAFSMDSGMVGVIDLTTKVVSRMKTKHGSICGTVKFIPDRPREIVSGGYDMVLLHYDFQEGKVLSSRKIPADTVVGGMSLSPPFIVSTAISSTGLVAAGTADGRLLMGCGGYKQPKSKGSKKKRSRKWEGLDEDTEIITKVAEGPIVAMVFEESGLLTISTLMGVISRYKIDIDEDERFGLKKVWQQEAQSVQKVNALAVDEERVIVGGLTAEGKGVIEIWKQTINYAPHRLPVQPPK